MNVGKTTGCVQKKHLTCKHVIYCRSFSSFRIYTNTSEYQTSSLRNKRSVLRRKCSNANRNIKRVDVLLNQLSYEAKTVDLLYMFKNYIRFYLDHAFLVLIYIYIQHMYFLVQFSLGFHCFLIICKLIYILTRPSWKSAQYCQGQRVSSFK